MAPDFFSSFYVWSCCLVSTSEVLSAFYFFFSCVVLPFGCVSLVLLTGQEGITGGQFVVHWRIWTCAFCVKTRGVTITGIPLNRNKNVANNSYRVDFKNIYCCAGWSFCTLWHCEPLLSLTLGTSIKLLTCFWQDSHNFWTLTTLLATCAARMTVWPRNATG